MGLIDTLRDFILAPAPDDYEALHDTGSGTWTLPTHSELLTWIGAGTYISPAVAMSIPGVFRCNVLTQDLSSQIELTEERRIITDTGQVRWERVANPSPIIRRPDLTQPTDEFVGSWSAGLAQDGETFHLLSSPDPATGRPTVLRETPPGEWTVALADNGLDLIYRWRGQVMKPGVDFIHTRYLGVRGRLRGMGPVQAYARTLTASGQLEDWAGSLWTRGGWASMYLTTNEDLDPTEAQEAKDAWIEQHGSELSVAVLDNGLEAKSADLDPDKAQALESRMWNVQFAAGAYGYNPYLLAVSMHGSSVTYQTLPDLFAEAIRGVVYPNYLRKQETQLSELLPRGRRARFNLAEFLRADEKTRTEVGVAATAGGLLTVDEWRAREGLPPMPTTTQERTPADA